MNVLKLFRVIRAIRGSHGFDRAPWVQVRPKRIRLVPVCDNPPTCRVEEAGDAVRPWEALAIVAILLGLYGAAAWLILHPLESPTPQQIHECRISYGCEVDQGRE